MEGITKFLNGMDFAKLVPNLELLQRHLRQIAGWAVALGPLVLLVMGLIYLLVPTKEANRKFGFRTYFGMGSPEAWQFTQRLAGMVYSALGGVLLVIMLVVAGKFGSRSLDGVMSTAVTCLLWQLGLVLAAYIGIAIASALRYDQYGDRR